MPASEAQHLPLSCAAVRQRCCLLLPPLRCQAHLVLLPMLLLPATRPGLC